MHELMSCWTCSQQGFFVFSQISAPIHNEDCRAKKNTHIHLSGRVNRRFFRTKAFTQTTRVGCMPEPPYLRETKTYHSQPVNSIRHAGNYFATLSIRPTFIFFVAEVMSNYLTTDGLKKFSLLPEAPWGPRPVAFATSATWLIRHWGHNVATFQQQRLHFWNIIDTVNG